jgi:uncharacterized membrane protein YfcA
MPRMDPMWIYPVLFCTGTAAGFVDSIAGGGGLMTIPVLLSVLPHHPVQDILGTNKLQASFGSGSATWHYRDAGLVKMQDCWSGILWTACGAFAGTLLVQNLHQDALRQIIPWLLVAIALYALFQPRLGHADTRPRMNRQAFYALFGLGIGFYDGFFGPGTGSFWAIAYVFCLGFNLTKATAHTKVMNLTSNLVSLLVFAAGNHVLYSEGLVMGVGQLCGARLGSRMVIARGTKFIRPIFITAALAVTAKLLYQNYAKN